LARIKRELRGDDDVNPESVSRAIFALLERRVTEGEIEDVRHVLPAEIRSLWP
jgi:uncharacterized protein (DUF2267 family)